MKKQTRQILAAIGIFWAVAILAIILNRNACLGTAHPWLLGNSISWYVGSQIWSALLFLLGNCIVAILISRFLWSLGEHWKMPRIYFFFVILLVIALAWLSVFPLGFFDSATEKSIVSYMHEAGSRTMFFAMAVVIAFLATKAQSKIFRMVSGSFVAYAIACAVAVLISSSIFYAGMLFFESFYIFAFMMLLLWCSYMRKNFN